jgi:hypothetical protein
LQRWHGQLQLLSGDDGCHSSNSTFAISRSRAGKPRNLGALSRARSWPDTGRGDAAAQ